MVINLRYYYGTKKSKKRQIIYGLYTPDRLFKRCWGYVYAQKEVRTNQRAKSALLLLSEGHLEDII